MKQESIFCKRGKLISGKKEAVSLGNAKWSRRRKVKCSLRRAGKYDGTRLMEMKYTLNYIRRKKPSREETQIAENDETHLETKPGYTFTSFLIAPTHYLNSEYTSDE